MGTSLPPIYRDIRRLLVHTEDVVRRFARYHKYTVGTDMRQQAMQLMRGVHRAVYEPARQTEHIGALVWLVDNYKLTLQLAMEVGAFTHSAKGTPSFAGFETAANLAAGIGKHRKTFGRAPESGGWQQKTASRVGCACAPSPIGAQAHPTTATFLALRSLCHKLLANKATERVRDPVAAALVPPHKRLANAAPGCGLPVGNLTSQFFANVYLNAQSVRLRRALFEQFAWLKTLFILHPDGQLSPRWVLQGVTFAGQVAALKAGWPQARCLIQKGNRWLLLSQPEQAGRVGTSLCPRGNQSAWADDNPACPPYGDQEFNEQATQRLTASLRRQGIAYVCANQTGWLRHGTRRREVQAWFSPNAVVS